jgi:hypothetical protein
MNIENMSREELVAALAAEKAKSEKAIQLKVSQKGCVQLNGIRRFPITFYKDEWNRIFDMKDQIMDFISAHDAELATK